MATNENKITEALDELKRLEKENQHKAIHQALKEIILSIFDSMAAFDAATNGTSTSKKWRHNIAIGHTKLSNLKLEKLIMISKLLGFISSDGQSIEINEFLSAIIDKVHMDI